MVKMIAKCPVCDSENLNIIKKHCYKKPEGDIEKNKINIIFERLWILFEKILKTNEDYTFDISQCEACGFIFSNPRFTDEDINTKYHWINELGSTKAREKANPSFNLDKRAKKTYKLLSRYIKKTPELKSEILDYGGASGYMLEPFIKDFNCNILDFEKWDLSESIKYLGSSLDDLNQSQQFDLILFLHTLEHVIEPKKFLEKIYPHLKKDGLLYVEVPLGCFREWSYIPEPATHLNFFSEQSLVKLFNEAGLDVIYIQSRYQWVTHENMWCINIIGKKTESGKVSSVKYLSAKKQMNSKYYHFLKVVIYLSKPKNWIKLINKFLKRNLNEKNNK